ncbi:MAG: hypothetical protein ACRYGL_10645 [Janthinobacterium lividum]
MTTSGSTIAQSPDEAITRVRTPAYRQKIAGATISIFNGKFQFIGLVGAAESIAAGAAMAAMSTTPESDHVPRSGIWR